MKTIQSWKAMRTSGAHCVGGIRPGVGGLDRTGGRTPQSSPMPSHYREGRSLGTPHCICIITQANYQPFKSEEKLDFSTATFNLNRPDIQIFSLHLWWNLTGGVQENNIKINYKQKKYKYPKLIDIY